MKVYVILENTQSVRVWEVFSKKKDAVDYMKSNAKQWGLKKCKIVPNCWNDKNDESVLIVERELK